MTGDPSDVTPTIEISSELQGALAALNRLFAKEIWEAKVGSATLACSQLKRTKGSKNKLQIVSEKFRDWQEESVAAIRKYFPQYIAFAVAHPELVRGDIWQWAEDSVWKKLHSLCGVRNPKRIFQIAEGVRAKDFVNRRMVWWFAVACHGNVSINVPPEKPWVAPNWLLQNHVTLGKRSRPTSSWSLEKDKGTKWLLASYTGDLEGRFYTIVDEELMKARVARSMNGAGKHHIVGLEGSADDCHRPGAVRKSSPQPTSSSRGGNAPQVFANQQPEQAESRAFGSGVRTTPTPILTVSEDYCSIQFRDESYTLTPLAGKIVNLLHEASIQDGRSVSGEEVHRKTRCGKVWDAFRRRDGRQFWKRFIVKPDKNMFALRLPE